MIAAIVLWAIASEAGRRSGAEFAPCLARADELVAAGQTGPDAQLAALSRDRAEGCCSTRSPPSATILILVDMIWKPGA